jgi:hypothetical protein
VEQSNSTWKTYTSTIATCDNGCGEIAAHLVYDCEFGQIECLDRIRKVCTYCVESDEFNYQRLS